MPSAGALVGGVAGALAVATLWATGGVAVGVVGVLAHATVHTALNRMLLAVEAAGSIASGGFSAAVKSLLHKGVPWAAGFS
jgi:hypothetical protein